MNSYAVGSQAFFRFDLRQPVNQWICLALIALMAFWVVLYYMVHRAEAFGEIVVDTYISGLNE